MLKSLIVLAISLPLICSAQESTIAMEFSELEAEANIKNAEQEEQEYRNWARKVAERLVRSEGIPPASMNYTWSDYSLYVSNEEIVCKLELKRRVWVSALLSMDLPLWTMKKSLECLPR